MHALRPLRPLPPSAEERKLPMSPEERDGMFLNNYTKAEKAPLDDWQNEWFEKAGYFIFKKAVDKKFSYRGGLVIIAHAYKENATTPHGRKNGYTHHNWWNFSALSSRNQITKPGYKFASFDNLSDAFDAYVDRITSEPDLIAYHNPKFNASYPDFGKLLKSDAFPTAMQINAPLRIGGEFVYCTNDPKYGSDLLLLTKTVTGHFITFLKTKISPKDVFTVFYEEALLKTLESIYKSL